MDDFTMCPMLSSDYIDYANSFMYVLSTKQSICELSSSWISRIEMYMYVYWDSYVFVCSCKTWIVYMEKL